MKTLFSILSCFIVLTLNAQQNFADCAQAINLCNKQTYQIKELNGNGDELYETGPTSCFKDNFIETQVAWFKWTVEKGGSLSFTLTPNVDTDDLDFVVYQADDYAIDCDSKQPIRCMASGKSIGMPRAKSQSCIGTTGLRTKSNDISESSGCYGKDDNFLNSLQTLEGDTYYLFVNNLSSNQGFSIDFSGSTTFQSKSENCVEENITSSINATATNSDVIQVGEIFPNPATNDFVFINITAEEAKSAEFSIYNLMGQETVMPFILPVDKGTNKIEINTESLSTGNYFVNIQLGEKKYVRKFVVINGDK